MLIHRSCLTADVFDTDLEIRGTFAGVESIDHPAQSEQELHLVG